MQIPSTLVAEHKQLHADLARAFEAGGETADAARAVAQLMHPHFLKEDEYAMPPLGLLVRLARGEGIAPDEAAEAIAKTDRLRADWDAMLAEHRQIVDALRRLREAASREGHERHAQFADKLVQHATNEEQVLYPAAILVGDILKSRNVRAS